MRVFSQRGRRCDCKRFIEPYRITGGTKPIWPECAMRAGRRRGSWRASGRSSPAGRINTSAACAICAERAARRWKRSGARAAQGIEFVSRYSFWAVFCALALAVSKVSAWFCLPGALVGLYALMCTALGISYTGLMRRLKEDKER